MARTKTITVDGEVYEVGWNEDGWFATIDGESTDYCDTLDELREVVRDTVTRREAELLDAYAEDCRLDELDLDAVEYEHLDR